MLKKEALRVLQMYVMSRLAGVVLFKKTILQQQHTEDNNDRKKPKLLEFIAEGSEKQKKKNFLIQKEK